MILKSLKYHIYILISIYSLNAVESFGQERINLNPLTNINFSSTLRPKSYYSGADNNLRNFPFGFGIGFALNYDLKQKLVTPGIIGNFSVNLSSKKLFLLLEYGQFFESKLKTNTSYSSAGLRYKFLKTKHSSLALHSAVFGVWNSSDSGGIGGGLSGFAALNYMYSTTEYFGISLSLRYPFGGFRNTLITAGFQFLTN